MQLRYPQYNWIDIAEHLYYINGLIWELEAQIRQGVLDNNIVEVGNRSIWIRKINKLRVDFKNLINGILKEGFQDIKKDHLSE